MTDPIYLLDLDQVRSDILAEAIAAAAPYMRDDMSVKHIHDQCIAVVQRKLDAKFANYLPKVRFDFLQRMLEIDVNFRPRTTISGVNINTTVE